MYCITALTTILKYNEQTVKGTWVSLSAALEVETTILKEKGNGKDLFVHVNNVTVFQCCN